MFVQVFICCAHIHEFTNHPFFLKFVNWTKAFLSCACTFFCLLVFPLFRLGHYDSHSFMAIDTRLPLHSPSVCSRSSPLEPEHIIRVLFRTFLHTPTKLPPRHASSSCSIYTARSSCGTRAPPAGKHYLTLRAEWYSIYASPRSLILLCSPHACMARFHGIELRTAARHDPAHV